MRKLTIIQIGIIGIAIFFHHPSFSIPPTPPVTQNIGMLDVKFGNQTEYDCRICHSSGLPDRHHLLVDSPIPRGSLVPYPDADGDGFRDTIYSCENCHQIDKTGAPIVVKDCMVCHNSSSPHHKTELAQARNCSSCHGDIVDDFDDGHTIPTYKPSVVTPWSSNKLLGGEPQNNYGTSAGNCDYCHDHAGQQVPIITTNAELHHQTFGTDETKCFWCHDSELSLDEGIRRCQDCHGYESLHNIQTDSPNPSNIGTIVIGGEDAGYGHVGRDAGPNDSDCWGCHGSSGAFSPNPNEHPNYHHAFYGQTIPSTTEAPFGNAGEMYVCFSCHDTNFTVIRHCSVCHTTTIPPWNYFIFDVDGDGKEGLAEAIHALQVVSGFFQEENTDQLCDDELDNDGDGYTDCDDFNCSNTAPCTTP